MGSIVTLGFSFENSNNNLNFFIELLLQKLNYIDEILIDHLENESWKNEFFKLLSKEKLNWILTTQNFKIKFKAKINDNILNVFIDKECLEHSFAIIINFNEEELLASFDNIFLRTNLFLDNFVTEIFQSYSFKYAFCDNNALYEYEILEFCYKAYKNFSISYIPFESKLKIIRQNWEIDGCTNRKPQIKLIK